MKSLMDIGPFGRAKKIIQGTAFNMARGYELQSVLNQIEEAQKILEICDSEMERKLTEILIQQLEDRLNDMILPPEAKDGFRFKRKDDEIPGKAI
tara:strand:- start:381 stop:665 length:285 start_codon:yes stop_codon:yes gene_type:complete